MTATGALVLSSDEVRIIGGLAGAGHAEVLVPDSGWAVEDQPVADVVATRGLLARGLIRLDTGATAPQLVLAPEVRALFSHPGWIFSVRRDGTAGGRRATLLGRLLAEELSTDIWRLQSINEPRQQAQALVDEVLDAVPDTAERAASVRVATAALAAADRIGRPTEAAALLAARGLTADHARTVARVLAERQATTTVRLIRHAGTTTTTAALTWLQAGTETWLAVPEAADGPDDPPDRDADTGAPYLPLPDQLAEVTRLEPVNRAELRAAVAPLLADLDGFDCSAPRSVRSAAVPRREAPSPAPRCATPMEARQ
jgi:hypothetical protein